MSEARLDDIIAKMLHRRPGLRRQLAHQEIFGLWQRIAGAQLARYVAPLEVRGHTLILGANGSVWAQEIQTFRDEILRRIAEEIGVGEIRDIRVKVVSRLPAQSGPDRPGTRRHATFTADEIPESLTRDDRSAAEVLTDLRRAHEDLRRRRAHAGWPRCALCGEHFPPEFSGEEEDPVCPNCRRERAVERRNRALSLVEELPWISAGELHRETGLEEDRCRSLKKERVEFWYARVKDCVAAVREGRKPFEDFRKRVMQILMAESGAANPVLERQSVADILGEEAAAIFFD
ncbi:MAG: DUF721 domain-containing protein [Bacillota bacterium]